MGLIERRVLPYLAGAGHDTDLDDLVGYAAEQTKVRFRAKAWALGALKEAGYGGSFDSGLYVWGRPYLITAEAPEEVTEWVLRYMRATPDTVDELAKAALHQLDPALADRTEPDASGEVPDDENLPTFVFWKMRLLRSAALALRAGRTEVPDLFDDSVHDAAELLTGNLQFVLLEFTSRLLPGWMDRGKVWPTWLSVEAELGYPTGFGSNAPLLGALPQTFPRLEWESEESIHTNYTVGGFVLPAEVDAARTNLRANHSRLAAVHDDADTATSLRKCDEAFALAQRIGGGFVEATEIYSGMEGKMN
ncbi:hypothetical protein [Nocardia sp. NBC_00511]|uniref:hypothetical protein n=1 Tax=Nocardia sp. NBC_00511 TaxID=2903591 RepID=UPI0030E275B9